MILNYLVFFISFCLSSFITNCEISVLPDTVGSDAELTVKYEYYWTESSSTTDLYLYNDAITSFFPGGISSNQSTALIEEGKVTIEDVTILQGSSEYYGSFTVILQGFKNPPSNCPVTFICSGSVTSRNRTASYLPTSLVLDSLSITPDPESTLGGYYPLSIRFVLNVKFHVENAIVLTNLTLQGAGSDCLTFIKQISHASYITCRYESKVVEITVKALVGGVLYLEPTVEMSIVIDKVKYNTRMLSESIEVELTDVRKCSIASKIDTDSWKPAKPASFSLFEAGFCIITNERFSTIVSTEGKISLDLAPILDISKSQLVVIEILGASNEPFRVLESHMLRRVNGSEISLEGMPQWNWEMGIPQSLIIENFKLPPTERPFQLCITTYIGAEKSDIDMIHHQVSADLNATRTSAKNIDKVMVGDTRFVSEVSNYSVTFEVPSTVKSETTFKITLPSYYDATEPCKANEKCKLIDNYIFELVKVVEYELNAGESLTLTFDCANPPTMKPVTERFLIEGHEDGYAAFDVVTYLSEDIKYINGTLKDLNVYNDANTAYDKSIYTISFEVDHKIIPGSTINLTFPSEIITRSATLKSLTINDEFIHSAELENLVVVNAFNQIVSEGSKIKIEIEHIRNPIMIGFYEGFVVSTQHKGYLIDWSSGGSISIDEPGTLPSHYDMLNKTNGAETVYNFIFESNESLPNSEDYSKNMTIEIPSQIKCNTLSLTLHSEGAINKGDFAEDKIEIEIDYPLDATMLNFTMECVNQPTTQPSDFFIFTLYFVINEVKMESVSAKIQTQTERGKLLKIPICATNTPQYPTYTSKSNLAIQRDNTDGILIDIIYVTVPFPLDSPPSPVCLPEYGTCKFVEGDIQIVFDNSLNISYFAISEIPSLNPSVANPHNAIFTVKTYTKTEMGYFLVDQADDAGKLSVKCNFPCKDCRDYLPDNCTSCPDNIKDVVLYLVRAKDRCEIETDDVCGPGYFKNKDARTCDPCTGECSECVDYSTYCTLCLDDSKVAMGGECKEDCDDGFYKSPGSRKCESCKRPCETCEVSATQCNSCVSGYFLDNTECISTCEDKKYADEDTRTCKNCDESKCNTCEKESTRCTSCYEKEYLEVDTYKCVKSCSDKYYISEEYCKRCHSSCLTCADRPNNCLSCDNLYLYKNTCISNCPNTTYPDDDEHKCNPCSDSCATCSNTKDTCTSCKGSNILDGTSCVESCRNGLFEYENICMKCADVCKACVNKEDFCTSCTSEESYVYNGNCYLDCPEGTIRGVREGTNVKVCFPCKTGCNVCSFNTMGVEKCIRCSEGYKLYEDGCVYICPEGYVVSSDGAACVLVSEVTYKTQNDYVPFPFLIAALIFLAIPIAGWARNPKSLLIENIIIGWTLVLFVAFIVQASLAEADKESIIFGVTLFSIITTVALNIGFIIPHRRHILIDEGFKKWAKTNSCIANGITVLGYMISFQVRRFYYTRFAGFDYLFVRFENLKRLLNDLNYFSMAFILFSLLPICIVNIYGYVILKWGSQLYLTMIETFILSFIMIAMILYVAKYGPVFPENFFNDDENYNETQAEIPTQGKENITQQSMITKVFCELTKPKFVLEGSEQRIHSQLNTYLEEKETDTRKLKSYPCSPKTQQKAYDFFDEESEGPKEQINNVINEPVDVDLTEEKAEKEKLDSLIQTIPMKKIQELKRKLQIIPEEVTPRKLFAVDSNGEQLANPLEINERGSRVNPSDSEMLSDNKEVVENSHKDSQDTVTNEKIIDEYKRKGDNGTLELKVETSKEILNQSPGCKTFFDGKKVPKIFDSSEGFKFSMVRLEKQSTDTVVPKEDAKDKMTIDLSVKLKNTNETPTNLVNNNKLHNIPDSLQSLTIEEQKQIDEDKVFEKSPDKLLDINSIFGTFDIDESNAILIRETLDGKLLDKNDKIVNKYGYLIDKDGNVINSSGEIVFTKENFEIEINKINPQIESFTFKSHLRRRSEEDSFMADSTSKYYIINAPANATMNESLRDARDLELERIYSPKYVRKGMPRYKNNLYKNRHTSRRRLKNSRTKQVPLFAFGSQGGVSGLQEEAEERKETEDLLDADQGAVPLFVSEYRKVRMAKRKYNKEKKASTIKVSPTNNKLLSESLTMEIESNYETIKKRVNEAKFPKMNLNELGDLT